MPDWKKFIADHLAPLNLGEQREKQMIEEMAQHLEAVFDEAIADGASEQEAFKRAQAHIRDWRLLECELILARRPAARLRSLQRPDEGQIQATQKRRGIMTTSFLQDLRYGARMLAKNRTFTAVAVLSLALGIGANTAIFSLIDAVLLKMLPVHNPNELVLFNWLSGPRAMSRTIDGIATTDPATGLRTSTSFSSLAFERMREHNQTLSGLFAFAPIEQLNVNADGHAEIAGGQLVSGDYYATLGMQAALGRTITAADDKAGAEPVAVITDRYWQRRFARDPGVIGKAVNVNNVAVTIIGVTPPEFYGTLQVGESPDLSIPMSADTLIRPQEASSMTQPWFWWVRIMGRLKQGVTEEQARANLEVAFQESALEGWNAVVARAQSLKQTINTEPRDTPQLRLGSGSQGLTELRREYSQPLLLLMILVGLVLLIACANLANLLLSRAATRQKEIAVRLAMGARRRRLIRQLLTESVMLAFAGGLLALVFAYWGKDMLLILRPWGGDALALDLKLDLRVLSFATGLSLVTGIAFGLVPALRATRVDLTPALKDNARSLAGGSRSRLSKALIVLQVALSVVLLIGAGLFVRTLRNLEGLNAGFNRENLLLFRVDPRLSGYFKEGILTLYQRLISRIEAVPGVTSATISRHPLLSGSRRSSTVWVQGKPSGTGSDNAYVNVVAPNFLDTMGIPLMLGRDLTERDNEGAQDVALINQAFAQKYFGDENPIGGRLAFSGAANAGQIEIIGVVRDSKYASLKEPATPTVYTPYLQGPGEQTNFSIRTSGDAAMLAPAIREAVREIEPNLPLFDVRTQNQQVEQSLARERMFATLSAFFGVLASLLACIGLYGVMSYAVARRTNEIGIRMALGARSVDVTRLVMRETMTLVVIGMIIGLGAALATTRFVESMLFGLDPTDPVTIVAGCLAMLGVAAAAGYLPARRASLVDPITALRYE